MQAQSRCPGRDRAEARASRYPAPPSSPPPAPRLPVTLEELGSILVEGSAHSLARWYLILLLAPSGTSGGEHLALAMTPAEFDATFARLQARGIGYGSVFNNVGSNTGPGMELGAHGMGASVYFFDPNKHLLEIRRPA